MPPDELVDPPHNTEDQFNKLVQGVSLSSAKSGEMGLLSDKQLADNYHSEEERNRSRTISLILSQYERAYRSKVTFQRRYRRILFWGCMIVVGLFAREIMRLVISATSNTGEMDLSGMATLITAIVSLVISIIKLVEIITAYCFPEKDEQYIVDIVRSIQENDLAKDKEYNRAAEAKDKNKA